MNPLSKPILGESAPRHKNPLGKLHTRNLVGFRAEGLEFRDAWVRLTYV